MHRPLSYPLTGAVASLVMLVTMAIARFTLGTPLLPELIAQQSFALISLPQLAPQTRRPCQASSGTPEEIDEARSLTI